MIYALRMYPKLVLVEIILCNNPDLLLAAALYGKTKAKECNVEGYIDKKLHIRFSLELESSTSIHEDVQEVLDHDDAWINKRYEMLGPIKRMTIQINSVTSFIPQSAAMDLYSVNDVKIWANRSKIYLRLRGGDAGSSYSATFIFIESKRKKFNYIVSERLLRQGEFSSEIFERTIYHNDRWDMSEK